MTALLIDWRTGDERAVQKLLPLVHHELRRIAKRQMAGERQDHVLQATALVNEAYLRLVDVRRVQWQDLLPVARREDDVGGHRYNEGFYVWRTAGPLYDGPSRLVHDDTSVRRRERWPTFSDADSGPDPANRCPPELAGADCKVRGFDE